MTTERPTIADIERGLRWALGLKVNAAQVIAVAQRREPILLDGPYGGEQLRVAQLLHQASGASSPLMRIERSSVFAEGASVFIDLSELKRAGCIKISKAFVKRLSCTVPIIASSTREFLATFDEELFPHRIVIPQLNTRRDEIPQLLVSAMAEHGFPVRLQSIGFMNLTALRDYSWRRNLAELRQCAHRLGAVLHSRSLTHAAHRLGISRQALCKSLSRFGLDLERER